MAYSIEFKPAAFRSLARIEKDMQKRLARKIEGLARNPRPFGAEKLKGMVGLYRVRVGDYRLIYQILDEVLLVLIVQIGHRRAVYR